MSDKPLMSRGKGHRYPLTKRLGGPLVCVTFSRSDISCSRRNRTPDILPRSYNTGDAVSGIIICLHGNETRQYLSLFGQLNYNIFPNVLAKGRRQQQWVSNLILTTTLFLCFVCLLFL